MSEELYVVGSCINCREIYSGAELLAKEHAKKGKNPAVIYDFYIDMMGREIEALYSYRTITIGVGAINSFLFPYRKSQEAAYEIDAGTRNVACIPHDYSKIFNALTDVKNFGYHRYNDTDICCGIYYDALNFITVTNAHHHSMADRVYRKKLCISVEREQVSDYFDSLRLTEDLRWCDADGKAFEGVYPEPRFALMYEFARRRELANKSECSGFDLFLEEKALNICHVIYPKFQRKANRYNNSTLFRKLLNFLGIPARYI
ncbi:MAG: hypothetical protein RRZ42_08240 [Oscillospiraceae bacterium]